MLVIELCTPCCTLPHCEDAHACHKCACTGRMCPLATRPRHQQQRLRSQGGDPPVQLLHSRRGRHGGSMAGTAGWGVLMLRHGAVGREGMAGGRGPLMRCVCQEESSSEEEEDEVRAIGACGHGGLRACERCRVLGVQCWCCDGCCDVCCEVCWCGKVSRAKIDYSCREISESSTTSSTMTASSTKNRRCGG